MHLKLLCFCNVHPGAPLAVHAQKKEQIWQIGGGTKRWAERCIYHFNGHTFECRATTTAALWKAKYNYISNVKKYI